MTLIENGSLQRLPDVMTVPISATALTPMDLLNRALSSGADLAMVEKLMELQERHERNQARKAFDAALSAARAEMPAIRKNRQVKYETKDKQNIEYRHEDLGEIAKEIDPILGRHGITYRWRTEANINEPVRVTCVVSHRDGHYEENTLTGPRDDSGKKNSLQQIASTLTYLQRYTLKASLGLAVAHDDDGRAAGGEDSSTITDDQVQDLTIAITETKSDLRRFLIHFKIEALSELPKSQFDEAMKMIEAKRGKAS